MANCNEHKNPLQHNGTSQAQRFLPGLDKNKFALVDEKDFADWIVFAGEFAVFINYYSITNSAAGNWQPFFSNDISAHLGTIAIQDIEHYRIEVKERFDFIRNDDNKSSLNAVKIRLNQLFSAILTLSKVLDDYVLKLPDETSLKRSVQNLIKTKLSSALQRLLAYFKGAKGSGYLNHSSLSDWKIFNKPLTDSIHIINTDGLSNNWFDESSFADWFTYKNAVMPDNSIFNNPLTAFTDNYLSIAHAANHNLFTGIFDTYLTTYTKIIQDAEMELARTLGKYDAHPAHYALFLSFLKLFRFTQSHINTITQRHLDFYYKKVLRLQPKPAEANKVHILGELAKQVDDYLLAESTALKAGKDSQNKDVSYTLDADTVFNKAKAAQLKTFYKADAADNISVIGPPSKQQNNNGRVFASSFTNSDDGLGAELTSTNKEWQPYVHKVYKEAQLESIAMPKAQIGFALASHYLYLTEGERKVFIRFVMNDNTAFNGKKTECWLTAEKEWYKVEDTVANPLTISSTGKKLSDGITSCSEISFIIPGSAPSIVNYNAAVHGGTYNCTLPVLKVYLINDDSKVYEYDALKDLTITKTEIRVEVGMDIGFNQKGLKNLLLSNDFGVLDASKPFMPFGGQPKPDTGFVIGHKEIFSKKNASLKLNIEWAEISSFSTGDIDFDSDPPSYPPVTFSVLSSGIWNKQNSSVDIFNGNNSEFTVFGVPVSIPEIALAAYTDEYNNLTASTVSGFLRLSLNAGFGYQDYINALSLYLIGQSKTPPTGTKPIEPYTPKIKSIYASYSAYCTSEISDATKFNDREIQFFHIYPFGEGEQHKYLQPAADVYLLPQFKHAGVETTEQHIGECYIGIEKLNPGEAINILFQIMEGTADPTVAKPPEHIHWFYLSNNQWTAFKNNEYSDNTLQLVQSGIISFAIPKTATADNTILPSGYIWLKAAITEKAEAVCKLISVDAQAAVATYVNNNNAEDFLDNALPAGTISKLKNPDAAIKKINQPYPSFGGRPKENEDHFYIRVSERIRHKARGITVWDYEHLVLEAFPEIYKVKCLNHTQIEDGIYNEVKPGYVSIITIPSLLNRNDANPLKPYTQQSTLTNIENFLRKHTSCFVNLHAFQPQFEEVRMEFSLKLYKQYKDFTFYANKLKEEITQFLSPWAYGNTSKLDFGGKIYKSVLINFIEERYYVDFITDVFMFVKVDDVTIESADMDEIAASTARSILVSAPAPRHVIHSLPVDPDNSSEQCPDIKAIPVEQT